ncbi:unnamed protein product [Arctia plantaginis]|uniref:Uncharacterized protein n=1 Tax=Arctia plantaginis TaxID=874455 RepID=A0A8S1B0W5_ARCPL|nr:unnamed protein product [Arctia plantaginis]
MKNRRRLLDSAVPSLYLPILGPGPTIDASADIAAKNSEIPVAGTSSEEVIAGSPLKDTKDLLTAKTQSDCLDTPTKQNRKCSPIDVTPSAYNTLVNKRLCRRIIELTNAVKTKNKKIKKLSDANRRLKRKFDSLKSLLAESENNTE